MLGMLMHSVGSVTPGKDATANLPVYLHFKSLMNLMEKHTTT